jgi:HK97 family phage major capsid protein
MDLREQLAQAKVRLEEAFASKEAAESVLAKALNLLGTEEVTEENIAEATRLETQGTRQMEMAGKAIERHQAEVDRLAKAVKKLEAPVIPAPLPVGTAGAALPGEGETDLNKSFHLLRYSSQPLNGLGLDELSQHKAMTELYGGDYRQIDWEQSCAFSRYLHMKGIPSLEDDQLLRKMYWPISHTAKMIHSGLGVDRLKSIMIEGVDILGGYAVPPQRANEILKQAMGLTAVRNAGAMVVQTSSKMIEWLEITGGDGQYPSDLRGLYGTETQNPTEDNYEYGLKQIVVHVYTYKVPFSVSLLEDADNVEQIFTQLAAETLAIDEDRDFLIGDGANKPRGILPGQLNANSLTEVNTGDADELTVTGLKSLRRGIASQYRTAGFSWVGNNDSGEAIENFQDGNGRFYWDALTVGEPFLGGGWYESESMASPAADAFPLILGNFSGYAIVERLGLTIQRYNDSNTGVNVVEFHIRRRIGGDVIEPWKFAVQKCST